MLGLLSDAGEALDSDTCRAELVDGHVSLRLEVVAGEAAGEKLSIDDGLVFGRLADRPGRLACDPELSRKHAEVVRAPSGQYSIEDLSSTNGTFVNGVRLAAPTVLAAGDLIDLGATRLIVRETPDAMPPAPAPVDVRSATTNIEFAAGDPSAGPDTASGAALTQPDTPPEAAGPGEGWAPPAAAPLDLRLVVDFERCEAEVGFPGGVPPIRLRMQDGRWRVSDRDSSSPQPQAGMREHAILANGAQQPDPAAQERHANIAQGAPTGEPVGVQTPTGEPVGVPAGFELATEQSDADGACDFGVLLEEQGDAAAALATYRRAADRGDANGAFNLGVLLEGQGDIAGALEAYRRADESGHAAAANNLGVLLQEQHDAASAVAAYRRAAQGGDANGAFNLGVLLEGQGDLAGAVDA